MTDMVQAHDVGSLLNPKIALAPVTIIASGTKNGLVQTGITIDRLAAEGLYRSADVVALIRSSGSSKSKAVVTPQVQDSADSVTWAPYGSASAAAKTVGATNATAAQAKSTQLATSIDLGSARRYVRVNLKASISGTNAHAPVTMAAALVLGGGDYNS